MLTLTRRSTVTSGIRRSIKVIHIINGLGIGGAEMVLSRLVASADREAFEMQVISLLPERALGDQLRRSGIQVESLEMSKSALNVCPAVRLVRLLKRQKPDVVQTWLQQSDLIGGIAAKLAGVGPVLWNIRHSNLHPVFSKARTQMFSRICGRLSTVLPQRIVCCSESSLYEQVKLGYAPEKMIVIPNGVDTTCFRPDPFVRRAVRAELHIPPDAFVLGAAGRFHPAKDHETLVRASAMIAARCPDAHFVFCGEGVSMDNPRMAEWVDSTGMRDRFHLLGQRGDLNRVLAALDIFVSSSCFSEGFPNVVSEAMACGIPCIVTDVGDSARIVGDTGRVVRPSDPEEIAGAVGAIRRFGPDFIRNQGVRAQRRISENFSLPCMVARYQQLYQETVAGCSQ